jgi:hypothetical protein
MTSVSIAETKERVPTKADLKIASAVLKKLGIDESKVKFDLDSLSWFQICNNSIIGGEAPLHLEFLAEVVAPVKINGLEIPPQTRINICDGSIIGYIGLPPNKALRVSGYDCAYNVHFLRDGTLCDCLLDKDAIVDGFKVPKGSNVMPRWYKNTMIFVPPDSAKKDLPTGVYEIKDGKAVQSVDQDHEKTRWCDY